MNKQIESLNDDDAHLAKHAIEYHGLTLKQFVLMCEEADKRYEGQFSSAVDKALAVECFYEGFKIACKEALAEAEKQESGSLWDFDKLSKYECVEYIDYLRKEIDLLRFREWQSLSDDEIELICGISRDGNFWNLCVDIARAIEQALKEKNGI